MWHNNLGMSLIFKRNHEISDRTHNLEEHMGCGPCSITCALFCIIWVPFSNLSPLYKVVVREVLLMISSPEYISLGIKLHMHLI